MRKSMKSISMFLLVVMIAMIPLESFADSTNKEVLVLGNDLTPQMIKDLKAVYGINHEVEEIIITNKEEHEALGKYISAETITNKSMSSAYIKLLDEGSGIRVRTHNINWVTEDMYKNALVTAGIKDAEVMVAGPFPVSGTAALTGSMKAYETLTGEKISKTEKDVANEEMVTTAKLSDSIGKEEAEKIITEVKIFVSENKVKDEETIQKAIEEAAEKGNVTISQEDLDAITSLMKRISKLELNVDDIKDQLGTVIDKLDKIEIDTTEIKGILARILDAIKSFFSNLGN